jgi:hypothetical protein
VNQAPQRAIVEAKAGGAVKAKQSGAAEGANAIGVEREVVLKWRVTGSAEVIRLERRRGVEAIAANGNTGESGERGVADAALGGKNKRKNSVGDRPKAGSGRSR